MKMRLDGIGIYAMVALNHDQICCGAGPRQNDCEDDREQYRGASRRN
jgi:hypothetical protein